MKVKILAPTYWNGKRLNIGDYADVDSNTAERWEKAGIAEKQASKPQKKTDNDKE